MDVYVYRFNGTYTTVSGVSMLSSGTLDAVAVQSQYSSLIWTERYSSYGDFELVLPLKAVASAELLKRGSYLKIEKSDGIMIIEDISIDTDSESGEVTCTITGRSFECVLERRVNCVLKTTTNGSGNRKCVTSVTQTYNSSTDAYTDLTYSYATDVIRGLIKWTFMNYDAALDASRYRLCPNFTCRVQNAAGEIDEDDGYTLDIGENIGDAVESLLSEYSLGIRATVQNGTVKITSARASTSTVRHTYTGDYFDLLIYEGTDRSCSQSENTPIILGPMFGNANAPSYYESDTNLKNAVICWSGDNSTAYGVSYAYRIRSTEKNVSISIDGATSLADLTGSSHPLRGLDLREIYLDRSSTNDTPSSLLDDSDNQGTYAVDFSSVDLSSLTYGEDYGLGDIVTVITGHGIYADARISEIIFSSDENGEGMSATLEVVDVSSDITDLEEDNSETTDD
ncbi:MAG: siphovirus ReqiPepy6 Gp37-like family protein [Oscillospiraceae bacterium]|nr:siphovirus ReqiPepy6 Gp37-like family protein [Oscillospiraceae bacterium]